MTERLLVIAAGGTGGHMFPAQSLAEVMLARGWRVQLTTDARGARFAGSFPQQVEVVETPSATFARGGFLAKLTVPFRILSGILAARRAFRKNRPAVVVGFGGYPSIPAIGAARVMKLPRILHEQNGVLGRVNQLFARHVDAIACGTWPTKLPTGVTAQHTGNPVRAAIAQKAAAPYVPADSAEKSGTFEILVTGGSQGARVLSDIVPDAIAALPQSILARLHVSHQARPEDLDRVRAFYSDRTIRADVQTFFGDMPDRLAQAHLVIARSGASTVADIAVIGRPAIFVPLAAAIRNEQTANAQGLVDAGAAIVIQESDLDAASLCAHISAILTDPQKATQMAKAALTIGRPDAAKDLAAMVETIAEGHHAST